MIAHQAIFRSNLVIFRGRLRALLSVFIIKFFRIELRSECVNRKIWIFFMESSYIPVLLWKRVLVSWSYILKTAIARHSNLIPFDSKWDTSY